MTDLTHYLTNRKHRERVNDLLEAIALLQKLEAEQRRPTAEERFKLLCYPGTGPMPTLFAPGTNVSAWEQAIRQQLPTLISQADYGSIKRVILNQHHTDPRLIPLMWQALVKLGFQGGKVLEPGCSIGLFAEFMPPALRQSTRLVGIEMDAVSYRIAKLLHPQDHFFNKTLKDFAYPERSFDAMIGNPPFSDGAYPIIDGIPMGLANLAIARAIQLAKAGAPMVVIVGVGVLDAVGNAREGSARSPEMVMFRRWLDAHAHFIGAIRLPMQTFSAIANTEAPADLLLLQKRWGVNDTRPNPPFIVAEPTSMKSWRKGAPIRLNEYYRQNPHRILGEPQLDKTTADRYASLWQGSDDELFAAIGQQLDDLCTEYVQKLG